MLVHFDAYKTEINDQNDGEHIGQPADFATESAEQLDEWITDETKCESVGNGIRKGDSDQRQERWNCFRVISPVNPHDVLEHHSTNDDECWSSDVRTRRDEYW